MGRRCALIAAPSGDEDATVLAGILADAVRGGYVVERVDDDEAVGAFLAARDATDVVLVCSDGVRVDGAALAACRSTHVLVLATEHDADLVAAPGAPSSPALRFEPSCARCATAAPTATATATSPPASSTTGSPTRTTCNSAKRWRRRSCVTHTDRHIRRQQRAARRTRSAEWTENALRASTAIGAVALLVSLPLVWLFGESGLRLRVRVRHRLAVADRAPAVRW